MKPQSDPHRRYRTITPRYTSIRQGKEVREAHTLPTRHEQQAAKVADVLSGIALSPWYQSARDLNNPLDPRRQLYLAHQHFFRNYGFWPDIIEKDESRKREARAWQGGRGWSARLWHAIRPALWLHVDLQQIGKTLGLMNLTNEPEHFYDHELISFIYRMLPQYLRGPYWAVFEIGDTGKVHLHVLCHPQPLPEGWTGGQHVFTEKEFRDKIRYLFKSPLPIPDEDRGKGRPRTHQEIQLAISICGLHLAMQSARKRGEKRVRTVRQNSIPRTFAGAEKQREELRRWLGIDHSSPFMGTG